MIKVIVRGAIGAAGRLAPAPMATWLERQLMTPRRVPQLALDPPSVEGRAFELPFEDSHVMATEWGGGPTVLLVHGWGAETRAFWGMVDPLTRVGLRVVALDLPAHGRSGGHRTTMLHCARAVAQVAAAFAPVHAVIAHSFGAPTATLAIRNGPAVERLVLVAPPLSVHTYLRSIALDVGFPAAVFERMASSLAERLQFDWRELATDFLVSDLDAPVLVVHDEADRVTPWTHGAAVARAARRGSLVTTGGLGHRAVLADPRVISQVARFIAHKPETSDPPDSDPNVMEWSSTSSSIQA